MLIFGTLILGLMKNFFLILCFGLFVCGCSKEEEPPFIVSDDDPVLFDDLDFERFCLCQFDHDHDGKLFARDVKEVWNLEIPGSLKIRSLKGIEYFVNLRELCCAYQEFKSLDVSHNTKLTSLICSNNPFLKKLNVSGNPELESLSCEDCALTQLDLSRNHKLEFLYFDHTPISRLDVRQCSEYFKCPFLDRLESSDLKVYMMWYQVGPYRSKYLSSNSFQYLKGPSFVIDGDRDLNFAEPHIEEKVLGAGFYAALAFHSIDVNADGRVSRREACRVLNIKLDGEQLVTLKDIAHLRNLDDLEIAASDKDKARLKSMDDVAEHNWLTTLSMKNLPLKAIDLGKFPNLVRLSLDNVDVVSLDVSVCAWWFRGLTIENCPALKEVWFRDEEQLSHMWDQYLDPPFEIRFKNN